MPDSSLRREDGVEGFEPGPPSRRDMGSAQPGWLGVELRARVAGQAGVEVVDIVRRSPASQAGLRPGDTILQVDGQGVSDAVTLVRRIRMTRPGTRLSLGVFQAGLMRLVAIRVEAAPSPDELLERRFVGRSAPPLDGLTVVSGDTHASWPALRGQLVVLEFWSPWCGVCRLMHDRLNEWQTQWAMYGVQVIGIAPLGPEAARGFATRFGMGYSVAADETESVFRSYDVFAVPSLFLVDRGGTIVDATTGYSSKRLASMERKLVDLVGKPKPP
jgi:peroxiredoxin